LGHAVCLSVWDAAAALVVVLTLARLSELAECSCFKIEFVVAWLGAMLGYQVLRLVLRLLFYFQTLASMAEIRFRCAMQCKF